MGKGGKKYGKGVKGGGGLSRRQGVRKNAGGGLVDRRLPALNVTGCRLVLSDHTHYH